MPFPKSLQSFFDRLRKDIRKEPGMGQIFAGLFAGSRQRKLRGGHRNAGTTFGRLSYIAPIGNTSYGEGSLGRRRDHFPSREAIGSIDPTTSPNAPGNWMLHFSNPATRQWFKRLN